MPWQEELEEVKKQVAQLQKEKQLLEMERSMHLWDIGRYEHEIHYLRSKLGEAQVEITRLHVLLEHQSKRK